MNDPYSSKGDAARRLAELRQGREGPVTPEDAEGLEFEPEATGITLFHYQRRPAAEAHGGISAAGGQRQSARLLLPGRRGIQSQRGHPARLLRLFGDDHWPQPAGRFSRGWFRSAWPWSAKWTRSRPKRLLRRCRNRDRHRNQAGGVNLGDQNKKASQAGLWPAWQSRLLLALSVNPEGYAAVQRHCI